MRGVEIMAMGRNHLEVGRIGISGPVYNRTGCVMSSSNAERIVNL